MFTGREYDAESGYYYFRNRYYDPILIRFTTRDPIGIWGDSSNLGNPYTYCGNNPLNNLDPFGLEDDPFAGMGQFQSNPYGIYGDMPGKIAQADPYVKLADDAAVYLVKDAGETVILAIATEGGSIVYERYGKKAAQGLLKYAKEASWWMKFKSKFSGCITAVSKAEDEIAAGEKTFSKLDNKIEPYNRRKHYGNTPTKNDRNFFGANKDEVIDHDPPLVKRYYEGDPSAGEKPGYDMNPEERVNSAKDKNRMKIQNKSESNKQGAEMSNYSKIKKNENGL